MVQEFAGHPTDCTANLPDVGDCPVAAPLPVLCVELECLTVCGALMAHYVTHGGGVVVARGVLTPVLEACTKATMRHRLTLLSDESC